jgi:uncharacterized membrane protein YbhN (UPF0104 family)
VIDAGDVFSAVASVAGPIGSLDGRFVAVALAFHAANLVCRSLAWRNALSAAYPEERVPLLGVGAAYAGGVALNGLLPARGGEAAKVGLVRLQVPHSSVVTIAASSSLLLLLDAVIAVVLMAAAWSLGLVPAAPPVPHPGELAALPAAHPVLATLALGALAAVAITAGRRLQRLLGALRARVVRGMAVLRSPRAYAYRVALPQVGAWTCRIFCTAALLAAFGLPASIPLAATVGVVGGMSTLVPATPGGVGTQQVLLVYVLHQVASTSEALSYSIGVQIGVTVVNTLVGIAGAMLVFRTARPLAAVRAGLRARG